MFWKAVPTSPFQVSSFRLTCTAPSAKPPMAPSMAPSSPACRMRLPAWPKTRSMFGPSTCATAVLLIPSVMRLARLPPSMDMPTSTLALTASTRTCEEVRS